MKKIASLTGILLVLMAGASFAAGLNLAWDNCKAAAGVSDKSVSCATTTTAQTMYGSFVHSVTDAGFGPTSTDNVVDIQVATPTLDTFWNLGPDGNGLGTRFGFGATSPTGCPTWVPAGEPLDNANFHRSSGNRIKLLIRLLIGNPGVPIAPGTEATAFSLSVNMSDAAGAAGCSTPACFVFNSCFLEDALTTGASQLLEAPQVSQHVTWQGGAGINCPAATPTQKKTWGSIKALYR